MLRMIISGGQTGVDRAALEAARRAGVPMAGWCPLGRRAEDGRIPDWLQLTETPSKDYAQRTEWNVRDSDGTLILHRSEPTGGSSATAKFAARHARPVLVLDLDHAPMPQIVAHWIASKSLAVLNVAGARESKQPGIYDQALEFLLALIECACEPHARVPMEWNLQAFVTNCASLPPCARDWQELTPDLQRTHVHHCGHCTREVYFCRTPEMVSWHARAGHCVAFARPGKPGDNYFGDAPAAEYARSGPLRRD